MQRFGEATTPSYINEIKHGIYFGGKCNVAQVSEEQDLLLGLSVAHRLLDLVLDPAFRLLQGREGAEGASRRGQRVSLFPSGWQRGPT